MFRRVLILVVVALAVVANTFTGANVAAQGGEPPFKLIGYYTSYSIYDPINYMISSVPTAMLTHLYYSPISISAQGQCESADKWADTQFPYPGDKQTERLRGNFKQIGVLKKNNPNLQVVMSVGSWDFSKYFSDAASTQQARIRFARSCVAFMKQYGFDGIDLDWRFPVANGKEGNTARAEDLLNYPALLDDLRGQLDYWIQRDGRNYSLSITVPAVEPLYQNFKLDELATRVDWMNLMAYSFQGDWSEQVSHFAPLFGSSRDPRGEDIRRNYNVDGAVRALLDMGVPASKVVVGLPFFAQAWRITRPNDYFGLYQLAQGVPQGTRPGGILQYKDMVPLLTNPAFIRFFDEETQSPWLYNEDRRTVISYEDPTSIRAKGNYIRSLNLGGAFVWELSFDDKEQTLLKAAANIILGREE